MKLVSMQLISVSLPLSKLPLSHLLLPPLSSLIPANLPLSSLLCQLIITLTRTYRSFKLIVRPIVQPISATYLCDLSQTYLIILIILILSLGEALGAFGALCISRLLSVTWCGACIFFLSFASNFLSTGLTCLKLTATKLTPPISLSKSLSNVPSTLSLS